MKPPPFGYERAGNVAEAIALLQEYGEEAKLLAGGQSLLPLMNFRLLEPAVLIDLNTATNLSYVSEENGHLFIGAMTRQRTVETSSVVRSSLPVLSEALRLVGHVAIRNRGTFGGSLAHADPAAEIPTALLALDGEISVDGPTGEKKVKAEDFFVGPFATVMSHAEVLTSVRIPRLPPNAGTAVAESARRHGDFGIVVAIAMISLNEDRQCGTVRVALGGIESTPVRLRDVESSLVGTDPSSEAIANAAEVAARVVDPVDDIHAPADYRRDMTRVFVRRALSQAAERAKEGAT